MISPSPHITAPYQRVGWTDCFVVRAASVADGHRLARFFGAVWLIDWLAEPPSLSERCLMGKDTQPSSGCQLPDEGNRPWLFLCLCVSLPTASCPQPDPPHMLLSSYHLILHNPISFLSTASLSLSAGCILTDCRLYLTESCFSTFVNSHIAASKNVDALRETIT